MSHRNIPNNQLGCGERRAPRSRSSNSLQTGQRAWTTFHGALRRELTKCCERQRCGGLAYDLFGVCGEFRIFAGVGRVLLLTITVSSASVRAFVTGRQVCIRPESPGYCVSMRNDGRRRLACQ